MNHRRGVIFKGTNMLSTPLERELQQKIKVLKKLIKHMWIHDGYPNNGYLQMTTEEKKLYCKIVGIRPCDWTLEKKEWSGTFVEESD